MKIFLVYLDLGYDGCVIDEDTRGFTVKERAEFYRDAQYRKSRLYSELWRIQEVILD